MAAGLVLLAGSGCAAEVELDPDRAASPVNAEDIHNSLRSVAGGETTSEVERFASGGPLAKLRQHPRATIQTWQDVYEQDAHSDARLRSSMLDLLGDLCIQESTDLLLNLAGVELPSAQDALEHHRASQRTQSQTVQGHAIRALGRVSGIGCEGLVDFAKEDAQRGRQTLQDWVLDSEQSIFVRASAGDALLVDHPRLAAKLRTTLPTEEEWMLTPFEERRLDDEAFVPPKSDRLDTPNAADLRGEHHTGEIPSQQSRLIASLRDAMQWGSVAGGNRNVAQVSQQCLDRAYLDDTEVLYDYGGDEAIGDRIDLMFAVLGYQNCNQLFEKYDSDVNFENKTWDEGFGLNDRCNDRKPLKRMVNALYILDNAAAKNAPGDYSGGIIHWAYNYIKNETPEFEGTCEGYRGKYEPRQCTSYIFPGWCWSYSDERILIGLGSFTTEQFGEAPPNVTERAATILHESLHAGGIDHTGVCYESGNCSGNCRTVSCDSRYGDGGVNTYDVQWLAQYARLAPAGIKGYSLKTAAIDRGNEILRERFDACPSYTLSSNGWLVYAPGLCGY